MPDYQKGKIYKIVDLGTDECYIGSTCESTLARRLADHVSKYKRYKEGKARNFKYITSFDILENDNYDIQLIENFPCESRDELHAREGHWIKKIDCVNKFIAGRTKKEYYNNNKETIIQKSKRYHVANKEKRTEQQKQYREVNKETLSEYNKRYREENDDKIKQQKKKYYNDNKHIINEKDRHYSKEYYKNNKEKLQTKIDCECGGRYTFVHKQTHIKTRKHQNFIHSK